MPLTFTEHTDPARFHDLVFNHLLLREAECCAMIGLANRLRDGYKPNSADELPTPLLWTIDDSSRLELVAIQTYKNIMAVTRASDRAMEYLAEVMPSRKWAGEFLLGVLPSIETLSSRYAVLSNRPRSLSYKLRVFQLEQVTWPKRASGMMQLCQPEDRHVLADFMTEFHNAIGEWLEEDALARADRAIADQRIYLWIDHEPVAMAGWAGPTPNGIRINSVYTRPESRGKGYASNLVASLTQHLLDQGKKYCFLFTDLANPTSNRIYQAIGYQPISDSARWRFGP